MTLFRPIIFVSLLILFAAGVLMAVPPTAAATQSCVIPDRGPWPPCATGASHSTYSACVIPPVGPWPACATGGVTSGVWPSRYPPVTPPPVRERVYVFEVDNGHTVTALISGIPYQIQLIGIEAPPRFELPCSVEAAGWLSTKVGFQWVEIERGVRQFTPDGQLLAYMFIGDRFINAEMIADGYALTRIIRPNTRLTGDFWSLERQAQYEQIGCLWEREYD